MLTETPPEHLKSASDIADFGEDVRGGSTYGGRKQKILISQNKSLLILG